jgi:D-alanine-D-alanine ligase
MKQKVAILYGGPSSEHEVSIHSAKNILTHIDTDLFEPIEIFIPKDGIFTAEYVKELKEKCDIIFPVLHGSFGEDGTLQKMLEDENITFVGSDSKTSRIAIDKNASNELFEKAGLSIPKSQIISKENSVVTVSFPIIVKPIDEGSSVGLYKCMSQREYQERLQDIFSRHNKMLVQEFIVGREFTCGVIEIDGNHIALPASEIIIKDTGLFDYDTKYTAGKCEEITPAHVSQDIIRYIQDTAVRCHELLGCKSISRTDFIMTDAGILYVLETNTLPGMTKNSFVPAQAFVYGLDMKQLVTALITSARIK